MPLRRILSLDTGYDFNLTWFESGRRDLYAELGAQFEIRQLGYARANRDNLLRLAGQREDSDNSGTPYFTALVISTHGEPGRALDNDDSPASCCFRRTIPTMF